MGNFSVLLLLGVTLAYVNADQQFGETQSGTKELVRREIRLFQMTAVEFNTENEYELIIDKVDILFNSREATLKMISGGPKSKEMDLEITPTGNNKNKISVTIIVHGRWTGEEKTTRPTDIQFGPKSTLLYLVLSLLRFFV